MSDGQTIRTEHGMFQLPADNAIWIRPANLWPARSMPQGFRWHLSPIQTGKLERLARARFEARQLMPEAVDQWDALEAQAKKMDNGGKGELRLDSPDEVIDPIAQTVRASTAIEGEDVYAKDVPIAMVEQPDDHTRYKDDYLQRVLGTRDLYKAYIWALSRPFPLDGGRAVTPEFISKVHHIAFSRVKPDHAGKWKDVDNQISWAGITLHLLPKEQVAGCLEHLCNRTNTHFRIAEQTGAYSKLMAVAEFVLDFLAIHPFRDGNGRTARLLSTYLLERAGFHFARFYPVDAIIEERQKDYYKALLLSQSEWYSDRENILPWIDFYLDVVFTQWLRAHQEIARVSRHVGQAK